MIAKLPDWYRVLALNNVNEETLEKRSKTIKKITKTKDLDILLNCVKLYLGKPITNGDFIADLTKLFLEEDAMFPQTNNGFELKVLAGVIISDFIETSKNDDKITVALALETGLCGVKTEDLVNNDIVSSVREFLVKESISKRKLSEQISIPNFQAAISVPDVGIPTITNQFTAFNQELAKITNTLKKFFEASQNDMAIMQEESNVHWWIFRNYSNTKKCPIKELSIESAPIILGEELSLLTELYPGIINAHQFFKKLLTENINIENKITLLSAVNSLDAETKELFKIDPNIIDAALCPFHLACSYAIRVKSNDGWAAIFESSSGVNPSIEFSALEIAMQVYNEGVLLRNS